MIYNTKELLEKHKYQNAINDLVKKGVYFKISHGFYSDIDIPSNLPEVLCLLYPKSVVTHYSAFYHYGFSDYVPDKYYIAFPHNSKPINNKMVKQFFVSNSIVDIGVKRIKTNYGFINIYDEERMLIELIRNKRLFSYPYYKEIVQKYRILVLQEAIDFYKIMKYCKHFKNGNSIMKKIQEEIL